MLLYRAVEKLYVRVYRLADTYPEILAALMLAGFGLALAIHFA